MGTTPDVSIVIPTFNRSGLVVNAIESARRQTITNVEIIVVDDGSTDDTAERLRAYLGCIRYHRQDNRGPSGAQNCGIALARAPWIAILADDDVWLPTKLEAQLRALHTFGDEFGACFTDCVYVGDPGRTETAFEQAGIDGTANPEALADPLRVVLGRHPALYVQSMLVSRAALERVQWFDERLTVGEDTDLIFRLALQTRFCVVRSPLVRIDRRPSREHGLMELFATRDDRIFECHERRYLKWLALPELTDAGIRHELHHHLQSLYYGWAIARLYDVRIGAAAHRIRQIHAIGPSYATIAATLAFRAARKLWSSVRRGTRRTVATTGAHRRNI